MPATTTNRELSLLAPLGFAALLIAFGGAAVLADAWEWRWLLQSASAWLCIWLLAWRRRASNVSARDSAPHPVLGWANRLTLLRGWLIAATAGFLLQPPFDTAASAWLPAICYTLAAILDRLDGFVARRGDRVSEFGSALDTTFDALGLLVAPLLALQYGKIHGSYLLVSVAYYLFQAGLGYRRRRGLPTFPLVPNTLRRTLAGFQMGFIAVVLWPLFSAPLSLVIGWAFMIPLLTGFVVDWFVVSGRIRPERATSMKFFATIERLGTTLLQPLLRLLLLPALYLASLNNGTALFTSALGLGLLASAIFTVAGLAARAAALVLLLLLAGFFPDRPLDAVVGTLIFCVVWIMLLGSGRFSLWQGDEVWIKRYDGA